jgi:hypothetical protein
MSTVFQFLPRGERIKDFGSDSEAVLVASVPQKFAEIVEHVAGHVEMLKL